MLKELSSHSPNIGKQSIPTEIQTAKGSKGQPEQRRIHVLIFMDFYCCAVWLVPMSTNIRSRRCG